MGSGGLEEGKPKPSGGAQEGFTKIYKVTLDLHFKEKSASLDGRLGEYFRQRGQQRQRNRDTELYIKLENCLCVVCAYWLVRG